jgi:hypothetical protein
VSNSMPDRIDHLTFDTGHTRSSARIEVRPDIIDLMTPGAKTGVLDMHGLRFTSETIPGGWQFLIQPSRAPLEALVRDDLINDPRS